MSRMTFVASRTARPSVAFATATGTPERASVFLLAVVTATFAVFACCSTLTADEPCPAVLPPLPEDVAKAKAEIIALAEANLDRWGDPAIQAQLDEPVEVLAAWFAENRPANELDLTRGSWKAVWYEDISIFFEIPGLLETDRANTFQVVRDGFYYNVARLNLNLIFARLSFANFLKGEFTIKDVAGPATCGERRRNVIDLQFTDNRLVPSWLPSFTPLTIIVDLFDRGLIPSVSIPGPQGMTGELWNLFVDKDLRVALGNDDDPSTNDGGLFVLVRQDFVEN